jgi:ferredoxin
MAGVRIEVEDFCEGTGFCVRICPEAFRMDPDTGLAVPISEVVTDPALMEKIENAETTCPARAIILTKIED